MSQLNIRMYSWFQGGLSWAYVMSRLAQAFEEYGHNVYFQSTNGLQNNQDEYLTEERMLKSTIALQKFGPNKKPIDIDLTYTVPRNFPKRFLANSKHKCAIYNYETTFWTPEWKKFYNLVDYYFPSSNFSAEVFHINDIPAEKIFVIPHGVDRKVFNKDIPKVKLKTKKKIRFVSVVAPHFRKNIPLLLDAYCKAFTAKDDVCLVLKTKVYKHSDGTWDPRYPDKNINGRKGFEIVLGDVFKEIVKKYGKNMPEIELLGGYVENVASIYNACHINVTTTGSEGYYLPGLESFCSGLINIAPNYSGHLDYMNEDNALLIDTKMRYAKNNEQYWTFNPKSKISECDLNHTVELMRKAFNEYDSLLKKFSPNMQKMVEKFSWENACGNIIDAVEGRLPHYIPGTYKLPR
jgi:glycosyltransferase involved in cell wall biosynthesis